MTSYQEVVDAGGRLFQVVQGSLQAAGAGFDPPPRGTKHPRLPILTSEVLRKGQKIDMAPSRDVRTFKKAPKAKRNPGRGSNDLFLF